MLVSCSGGSLALAGGEQQWPCWFLAEVFHLKTSLLPTWSAVSLAPFSWTYVQCCLPNCGAALPQELQCSWNPSIKAVSHVHQPLFVLSLVVTPLTALCLPQAKWLGLSFMGTVLPWGSYPLSFFSSMFLICACMCTTGVEVVSLQISYFLYLFF